MDNMPRKTRSDAKLEQLSLRQRERLHLWLEDENRSYAEVVHLLRSEFHLTVGKSAVSLYWRRHLLPSRHQEESAIAAAIAALPSGAFDAATLNQARALAWTALTRQQPQVQEAATLLQLLHRADRLAIARHRLTLEERRLALREASALEGHAPPTRAPEPLSKPCLNGASNGRAPARHQPTEPRLPLRSLGEGVPPSAGPERGKEAAGAEESKSAPIVPRKSSLVPSPPPPRFPGYSGQLPPLTAPPSSEQAAPQVAVPSAPARHQTWLPAASTPRRPQPRVPVPACAPWA